MAKNYEDRRLPERVYARASELRTQLNNGEPYGSYVKIAGELLQHENLRLAVIGNTDKKAALEKLLD